PLAQLSKVQQAMLNARLDNSRLSVARVRPQRRHLNLRDCLRRLIASLDSAAAERGIEISLQCPPRSAVFTDPVLLERLVRNYLTNALVHSGARKVLVRVSEGEEQARIEVVDDGCGLSREDQQRI